MQSTWQLQSGSPQGVQNLPSINAHKFPWTFRSLFLWRQTVTSKTSLLAGELPLDSRLALLLMSCGLPLHRVTLEFIEMALERSVNGRQKWGQVVPYWLLSASTSEHSPFHPLYLEGKQGWGKGEAVQPSDSGWRVHLCNGQMTWSSSYHNISEAEGLSPLNFHQLLLMWDLKPHILGDQETRVLLAELQWTKWAAKWLHTGNKSNSWWEEWGTIWVMQEKGYISESIFHRQTDENWSTSKAGVQPGT